VGSRRAAIVEPAVMSWSEVTLVDARKPRVRRRVRLPSCHLSEAAVFTPDSRYLLVPAIRVRNLLPIVQVARGWVLSSVLAVVEVETGAVSLMPLQYANEGFADPTGVAVSPEGDRAYVLSGGVDEVGVIDLPAMLARLAKSAPEAPEDFGLTRDYVIARRPVGDNPRGLVWLGRASFGDIAISNRLDDDVYLLDRAGDIRARVPLEWTIPDDAVHRGRRAFFDARYCFQNMFSCTSCHPEGHTDGLTYDFEIDGVGQNPVLNRSLLGLAETEPYKWTGINPSLQNQCGARFSMVLTRARSFPPAVLDDMAAFVLSLPPPRPLLDLAAADAETRASVERGRRLFARSRLEDGTRLRPGERCITCHPPPHYTNRQRTDVGTRGPLDGEETFDVPHLTGTGTKAPYLHDGRALTLEAVLRSLGDRHGVVSDLSDDQIRDLVRFLESL
jgi:cytochrome c peroxidase